MSDDIRLRMLFVCTGNVCRSAFAEQVARARLASLTAVKGGERVLVSSAGTHALAGEPIHWRTASLLRSRFGLSAHGFEARQLTARMVADSDLVLVAEREHRAIAVRLHPPAVRYTFTLREFGRLVPRVGGGQPSWSGGVCQAKSLVGRAALRRCHVPPADPGADDVPDPYNAPRQAHDAALLGMADALIRSLTHIAGALAGGA